jgi:hypothetical protein
MKRLILFTTILALSSLACQALVPTQPTATMPPSVVTEELASPTPEAIATDPVSVSPEASATSADGCATEQFFTDEFAASILCSAWTPFIRVDKPKPDSSKVTVGPQNGRLIWDLGNENVFYYLFYNKFTYDDVKVEVSAENRGKNKNNVSLICRYDPAIGWYEFDITSSGLYTVFYAEVISEGRIRYNKLTNGASNKIQQGKAINEYAITCVGENLTLIVNGTEVKTIAERKYGLSRGQVGVGVFSADVLPIAIEMEWFRVSQP